MAECKPSHTAPLVIWATHDLWTAFVHSVMQAQAWSVMPHDQERAARSVIGAIAFVAQAAIEASYDAKTVRAVEEDLIKRFTPKEQRDVQ